MERTFVIIKPDGVQRGLIGEIVGRFERRGLKIAAMRFLQVSDALARKHYAVHEGKPFLDSLCRFMSSGPIVPMILGKDNAVNDLRALIGATDPKKAVCGTLRYDLAVDVEKNSVHASDSVENAAKEIGFFFSESR